MGLDANPAAEAAGGGVTAGPGDYGVPWMTLGCCAVILGLFAGVWVGEPSGLGMVSGSRLSRFGALDVVRVWLRGEWWRVVTGGWLHGSWVHVLLNAVGLWSVGRWVESAAGPWRMLGVLVVASVLGCLTSLATVEAGLVVGISGGVFGLAGGLLVLRTLGNDVQRQSLARISPWELGFWLTLWLVIGGVAPGLLGEGALIAQGGHIGGLVSGSLATLVFGVSVAPPALRRWQWLAAASLLAGLLGLGWRAAGVVESSEVQAIMGYRLLEDGAFEPAAAAFERALVHEPKSAELLNARAYALAEAGSDLEEAAALVEQALVLGGGDETFEANALDTQAWIDCRAGRTALGTARLRALVGLAEERGLDLTTFEEHAEACSSAVVD